MQIHDDPVITLFNSDMSLSPFLSDLPLESLSNNHPVDG